MSNASRPTTSAVARTAALTVGLLAAGCGGGGSLLSFLPACPAEGPLFTMTPIADGEFTILSPMGGLAPPVQVFPSAEVQFFVPRDGDVPRAVPVVAPGVVTVWRVELVETVGAAPPQRDFVVRFAPCANVSAYVTHVQTLAPVLAAQVGDLDGADCNEDQVGATRVRTCGKTVRIPLAAGEAIGTAGGVGQPALGFGLGDNRRLPLPYVDKTRDTFDPLHAACPIDYFDDATRDGLRARFSDATQTVPRTAEPVCGEIAQDLPGKAQGRWFLPDTAHSTPEAPHLALVHDNVVPTVPIFSVGTSIPGFAGLWTFTPGAWSTVNVDFDAVAPGAVYCWDVTPSPPVDGASGRRVVVTMPDDFRLWISARSGVRCADETPVLGNDTVEFVR